MNFNIVKIMSKVLRRQFENVVKQLRRVTRFLSRPYQTINKFVREMLKTIFLPPANKSDYYRMGERYIAKKLVFLSAALLAVIVFLTGNYIIPWAEGRLWAPTITINSPKYHNFNGRAKVVSPEGVLIYSGNLQAGRVTGPGTQYDVQGVLRYSGDFVSEEYEGQGKYYQDGLLYYEGELHRNQFDGEGTLFSPEGIVLYKGQFEQGQPHGQGTAYDKKSGERLYEGQFAKGRYEGQGYHFAADGETVIYEGGFISGEYSGPGRQYREECLIYDGEFANGLFQGQGRQYDAQSGRLIYEGGFSAGMRQGEGRLYDLNRGTCIFNGRFFEDEIDFASYLGLDYQELKPAFQNETYIDYGETGFVMYYKPLHTALICAYADENRDTTMLRRVMVAGGTSLGGIWAGDEQQTVELKFGRSFTQIGFVPDEGQLLALKRLGRQISEEFVSSDKYIVDNYYCRYYYDRQSRVIVMELGAAE